MIRAKSVTKVCCAAAHPDATARGNRSNINGSLNPFSSGPRNCIGQTLAMAELRTILAVLIGNFCFELPDGVQRESFIQANEVWRVTLQAQNALELKVKPIMESSEEEDQLKAGNVNSRNFFYQDLIRLAREADEEAMKAGRLVRFRSGIHEWAACSERPMQSLWFSTLFSVENLLSNHQSSELRLGSNMLWLDMFQ